jgi:hypothetical protein
MVATVWHNVPAFYKIKPSQPGLQPVISPFDFSRFHPGNLHVSDGHVISRLFYPPHAMSGLRLGMACQGP